jgi:fumarylacetoacetate (FAA) hydrolase
MKLATYNDGSRDGQLLVVSRDLASAHFAGAITGRLQQVLDDWNFVSPQLEELSLALNQGRARHAFPFDAQRCMAPLPRAFQWAHSTGDEPPGDDQPALRHGAADAFFGPHDAVPVAADPGAALCAPALAVLTGDVARGTDRSRALDGVRLLLLAGWWGLRAEATMPIGCAFAPLAVTPDEAGAAWSAGRAGLQLHGARNGRSAAICDTRTRWHFGELISALATLRALRAGSIVSCQLAGPPAGDDPIAIDGSIRLELLGADGNSLFGAIEQRVVAAR